MAVLDDEIDTGLSLAEGGAGVWSPLRAASRRQSQDQRPYRDKKPEGQNAVDIAPMIDGMDLLAKGRLDGFCLVTSDSDFTGVKQRLR